MCTDYIILTDTLSLCDPFLLWDDPVFRSSASLITHEAATCPLPAMRIDILRSLLPWDTLQQL